MKTASWVIVNRQTREALFETFSAKIAASINCDKYEAVPILEYLQDFNAKVQS